MKPIVFHSEAQKEMDMTFEYYEGQRPGLGYDFVAKIEEATALIQQVPRVFAKYKETEYRRCLLKRFPYLLLYRETDNEIRIIAVAHTKRKPLYWVNRSFEDDVDA